MDPPWLREWLLAAARLAPSFNAADTAQSFWALATLVSNCRPHPVAAQDGFPSTLGLSSSVSSRSNVKQQPMPERQKPSQQSQIAVSSHPELLRVQPEWISLMLSRTRPRLAAMSAPHMSMMVWALSVLRARPGWQWSLALFDASTNILEKQASTSTSSSDTRRDRSNEGVSGSGMSVDDDFLVPGRGSSEVGRPSPNLPFASAECVSTAASPRDLAVLLLGLGRLRLRPLQVADVGSDDFYPVPGPGQS